MSSSASDVLITSVLFVALGCIVSHGQSNIKILAAVPYTVLLFIIGVLLNLCDNVSIDGNVVRNSIMGIGISIFRSFVRSFVPSFTLTHSLTSLMMYGRHSVHPLRVPPAANLQ